MKKLHSKVTIETETPPIVELDSDAHAAYVRFSHKKVAKTNLIHSEDCIVTLDLDENGQPVGVELIGVEEFGVYPLLEKAGMKLPDGLADKARYVPANLLIPA